MTSSEQPPETQDSELIPGSNSDNTNLAQSSEGSKPDKEKKPITVYLDGKAKQIQKGIYTTEQLIDTLGVKPGYLLNVKNAQGQLEPLAEKQETHVKKDMTFVSQVPCGGSS